MRFMHSGLFFLLVLVCATTENATQPGPSSASATVFHENAAPTAQPQLRTPDAPLSQPGTWPQQGTKRQVDVTQLKVEAQELQKLVEGLPEQMDKIGNGVLPKNLIENLKKIEKLSKQIRSEIT